MLRTSFFTAVCVAALSTGALAADLYGAAGGYKDGPAPYSPLWSGFYLGGHGGGVFDGDFDFHTAKTGTPGQKVDGGFGGVQAGYNWQLPNNFVFGVEADASFGDLSDKVHDGSAITESSKIDAFGTARARLGYSFGRFLPYVTGGLSWANAELGENCPPGASRFSHCGVTGAYNLKDSETYFGWTVGGGAEFALTPSWSLKAEYLHYDLGNEDFKFDGPASPRSPNLTFDTVKAGVNYHFTSGYEPLK